MMVKIVFFWLDINNDGSIMEYEVWKVFDEYFSCFNIFDGYVLYIYRIIVLFIIGMFFDMLIFGYG